MDERRLKSWHHIIYYYATACFSSIYTCTTQCFGHPRSISTYFLRLNTCWQPKTKKYCFVFLFWCAIYRIRITTKNFFKKKSYLLHFCSKGRGNAIRFLSPQKNQCKPTESRFCWSTFLSAWYLYHVPLGSLSRYRSPPSLSPSWRKILLFTSSRVSYVSYPSSE